MTFWTSEVSTAIEQGVDKLKEYMDLSNHQISKIVELVRGELTLQNRITLGKLLHYYLF